jgi:hypothetical protein
VMTSGSSMSTGVAASSGDQSGAVPKTRREGPLLAALYPTPAALPGSTTSRGVARNGAVVGTEISPMTKVEISEARPP